MNASEYNEPIENFIDVPDGKIHYLDGAGPGCRPTCCMPMDFAREPIRLLSNI
jgi:hypothetical protein